MFNNILNSFLIKSVLNRLISSQKIKFFNIIFYSWIFFKKLRIKPTIFFFLIVQKIRPIFKILVNKPSKKVKKKFFKTTYIPKTITIAEGFLLSLNWFLLPFFVKKKYKHRYNQLFENCFLFFLDNKRINLALKKKKIIYLKSISLFRYQRFS